MDVFNVISSLFSSLFLAGVFLVNTACSSNYRHPSATHHAHPMSRYTYSITKGFKAQYLFSLRAMYLNEIALCFSFPTSNKNPLNDELSSVLQAPFRVSL